MQNADIAAVLKKVGQLLELEGANPFRIRAYENAARYLESEAPPMEKEVAAGSDLTRLPSIGREMAAHIEELVSTGELALLEELGAKVPLGLIDVIALPGVGPKKAVKLWQELGVETVVDLEAAAKAGRVSQLPGFGEKTETRILAAIEQRKATADRVGWAVAERQALPLLKHVEGSKAVRRIEIAGSFRRRRETVGDLDILAVASKPGPVIERFTEYREVATVEAAGDTRATVFLRGGLQVDLRVVPAKSFGAALIYFTGSKAHNLKLRQRAIDRGLRMSEYGVFRSEKTRRKPTQDEATEAVDPWEGELMAGKTERAVYRSVGLPWIAPELREDRGEIEAAEAKKLPKLLELDHIRGDLQMHSTWSDGKDTLAKMVAACAERGYEYMAITDHSPFLAMVGGLDARRLARQRREIEKVQARYPQIRILAGQEVDILADGRLDQEDDAMAELDLVVAAIHSRHDLEPSAQTRRIVKALEHPAVNVLAHPTGRKIGRRRPMDFDLDEVLHCAAENDVAVELNALPARLDLKDTQVMRAKEIGVRVAISTDAHKVADLDWMRLGVDQARRGWLEKNDVVNTLPLGELEKALGLSSA